MIQYTHPKNIDNIREEQSYGEGKGMVFRRA